MLRRDFNEAFESVFENGKKYFKFQDFVIPSLKLSRIFGFIPFEIDDEGYISSQLGGRTCFYCLLMYVFNFSVTMSTQMELIRIIRNKAYNKEFLSEFNAYLKLITLTPQLLGPLPFLFQKKKFIRFFRKWRIFQEDFERVTGNELQLGSQYLRKIATFCISSMVFLPFGQFIFEDFVFARVMQALAFSVQLVHQTSLLFYWCLVSRAIFMISTQYHQFFVKEVHSAKGYTESIESYRLLWLSLCRAANDFASSIGATITVFFVFHVLYLILDSYRYCVVLPQQLRNSGAGHVAYLLWDSGAILCVLFLYCNIGHNVPKYCSNNMLTAILKIKENSLYPSLDDARINVFLFAFEEYVPVVSVSGFYEINRSLYGGIVSILVTYMIVIFQLKDSM